MIVSELTCEYHPSRQAVDKCIDCGKLICLEDKQVAKSSNNVSHSAGSVYCSICYYTYIKSQQKGPFSKQIAVSISFVILIFFGGFLLLLSLLNVVSTFLTYFFVVFIGIAISMIWLAWFLSSQLSSNPGNIDRARLAYEKLRDSQTYSTPSSSSNSFCMSCGTAIKGKEAKCLSCGEPLYPAK